MLALGAGVVLAGERFDRSCQLKAGSVLLTSWAGVAVSGVEVPGIPAQAAVWGLSVRARPSMPAVS
ncbi:hypothetical protein GCM10018952_29300 [Streptosporangium vulgare]